MQKQFPAKIISGGQLGADIAGLDAATHLGLETGGTAPKGYLVCTYEGSHVILRGTPATLVLQLAVRGIGVLIEEKVKVLNVAGNRYSPDNPDIYNRVYDTLIEALGI